MSEKSNPYPIMPKNFLAKGVWSEMNTGKNKYIGHLVYPMTVQDTSEGEVYKLDTAYDQHYNDNAGPTETAPEIHSGETGIKYKMEQFRFNYLLNPKKINKAPNPARKRAQEEEVGTIFTTRACRLKFEKLCADALFAESVWTTENSSSVDFSDPDAEILSTLYTLAGDFELLNGYLPSAMVIGGKIYNYILANKQIVSKIPNIDWNNITDQNILNAIRGAQLQNLQTIYVGRQSYTISNVKEATIVRARLWGDYIWMGDIDESIAGKSVDTTDGATMGVSLDGAEDPSIRTWRTENMAPGVEFVEADIQLGTVNVDVNKGALLKSLLD